MANTKWILSKIKIEGALQDIITKTTGEYVTVTYNGKETTLASALASIFADISNLPTDTGIDEKIEEAKKAVEEKILGGAVPETMDTIKEIADYVEEHKEVAEALNSAIGGKVDKVDGKGLSTEDFTSEFKAILENLPTITTDDVENWNNKVDKVEGKGLSTNDFTDELKTKLDNMTSVTEEEKESWNSKADNTVATAEANGLMSKEDKTKLDEMKGIRVGETIPADMKDGEIFVQVVTEE